MQADAFDSGASPSEARQRGRYVLETVSASMSLVATVYVNAPMSDEEREEIDSLIEWFQGRYPSASERLEWGRHAWLRACDLASARCRSTPGLPSCIEGAVIVAESRRVRRLVGRLDKGSDLLDGLAEVCRTYQVRAAEVRAIGSLEQVVLTEYDQRARQMRPHHRFDAQFEIVSLQGNISEKDGKLNVHCKVSLSRERDNGIELVGGQLQSGRVFAVEFVMDVFDDLILRRQPDAQTGLSLWREAISLGEPAPAAASDDPPAKPAVPFETAARTSWEDVVAASDARPARAPAPVEEVQLPQEEVRVSSGDLIDHPKFGRCVVERVEGDYEFVSARLRNARLIRLSLDVMTLVPAGEEGGKRLFKAVMGA